MIKQVRAGRWTMAAVVLLGLASCADMVGDEPPGTPDDSPQTAAPVDSQAKPAPYKTDSILVRFKSGVGQNRSAALHRRFATQVVREFRIPSNLQVLKVPTGMSVEKAVEAYQKDPDVLYAEFNNIYQLARTPNDARFGELWGLNNTGQSGGVADADINATEAWETTTGSSQVIIGLLDSGFDYNHEDLAANIFSNPGEIAGNGIDDDGNGFIDDVHGIDAVSNSGNPMDTDGHGTHVTGTIAGNGNNGIGVAGVNWTAKVVACRAFNPSASLEDLLQCMDYFLTLKTRTTNPVDIVATNNSWGGGGFSQALLDAIEAHRAAGMLFIAAAGNAGSNNDAAAFFPATYEAENIISVAASTRTGTRASFSNFGSLSVDIGAPGQDIFSTLPGNSYGLLSGTSMATPHVTGLVGLLKAHNPNLTAVQIKNLILTGGTPTAGMSGISLSGRHIRADTSLNCQNRVLANRVTPTSNQVITGVGTAVPLALLSITCATASTVPQIVTIVETGETITLVDASGGGLFQGSFTPTAVGTTTLTFPNGDVISISAVGNYDPARVVPFERVAITGTVLPLLCDDCSAAFTSPFPIRFAGAEPGLTTVNVGSNGILSFTSPVTAFSNVALPSTVAATIVAPFWDDLLPSAAAGSSVRFEVVGAAPSRQLVIEYRDVPHFSGIGAATFQVVFFEGNPNIQFNYVDVDFGDPAFTNGLSATVGVQVQSGVAQQFSFNTASLSNNLSLLWSMGAPLAVAGPDQVVLPGASVELDGSASTDSDGEVVSFAWTQTVGTPVTLIGADTATPSFTAPDVSGTLTFRLDVTDDEGNVGSDFVNVIVNRPPVAVTNPDFRIGTNLQGTLDGTASTDPDGVIVGFHWRQVHGDAVVISNADTAIATFISPATPQFLVFELTVVDEHGFTGSTLIVVDVFNNAAPIADAGDNRIVRPGSLVTLDGSGSSDPDGTITSFAWTVTACFTIEGACTVTLTGANTATPSFEAPTSPGILALQLTVTDNTGASSSDTIALAVFLQPPVAVISTGAACAVGGGTVTLDGSRSVDPDGDIVSYSWEQLSGPAVTLSGADTATASFTAPASGTLTFSLTVTDADGLVGSSTISFTVDAPPVANATASAPAVVAGTTVTLDGSTSTDAVSFSWVQTAGTPVTLSNPGAASPTFVAAQPSGPFELVSFQLTVTDACGSTSTDSVTIVVVAGAGG